MRYKLSEYSELCGFKNLPFALMEKRSRKYFFFDRQNWEFFQRVAYGYNFKDDELSEEEKLKIKDLVDNQIVVEATTDEKVPIPPYHQYKNKYRESVQWSITGKCNAHCKHCFMSAPDAKMGEPTLEQCFKIIEMLDECGVRKIAITGGEPFVRKDFWQIVDKMIEHRLDITTIYSNGILVNQKLLDEFIKRDLHPSWQISFDGVDGWHDWMRGVENATSYAVNAIKLLRANDFNVSCATSFFKGNVSSLPRTIDYLADLGVRSVKLGCMLAQGEWLKYPEQWLSPEEELAFYLDYIPKYIKSGRRISLQCEGLFMGYSDNQLKLENSQPIGDCATCKANSLIEEEKPNKDKEVRSWDIMMERRCPENKEFMYPACEVVRKNFYIGATDAVLPCMSLEGTPAGDKFPNLFNESLCDILTDSYYIKMSEASIGDINKHNPECQDCEYKLYCCAGCRAMAVGSDGDDYLKLDSRTCMMVKQGWPKKLREAIEKVNK